jgi:subtilisin family serine protease
MTKRLFLLAAAGLLGTACGSDTTGPVGPGTETAASELAARGSNTVDVIVTLDDSFRRAGHGANKDRAAGIARSLGVEPSLTYGTAAFGFAATIPAGRLNGLRRNPHVKAVEIDGIASIPRPVAQGPNCDVRPDHPKCDGGGGDPPPSGNQATPWGITRVGGAASGAGKTVWIIDTGVDQDHPDLNVDTNRSTSFVSRGKFSKDDENGHGTHVAGTVAAIDNDRDVVGVAAGATVVGVRVLDRSGSGSYSWIIAGVDYVAANAGNGDVANMSLGGGGSTALDNAVRAAANGGVRFSLAAGNESQDASNVSPARANGNNIYTVSAIGQNDCLASFSNFGSPVDYAAPGVGVESLKRGGGTVVYSGTSMAAPHVAGLLLLGTVRSDGVACNDPDNNPDPIAHR